LKSGKPETGTLFDKSNYASSIKQFTPSSVSGFRRI